MEELKDRVEEALPQLPALPRSIAEDMGGLPGFVLPLTCLSSTYVGQLVLRQVATGKRYGNVVLVASPRPLDDVTLTRHAARATFPTRWRTSAELARAERGVRPFGEVGEPSPPPPDSGPLRLR